MPPPPAGIPRQETVILLGQELESRGVERRHPPISWYIISVALICQLDRGRLFGEQRLPGERCRQVSPFGAGGSSKGDELGTGRKRKLALIALPRLAFPDRFW